MDSTVTALLFAEGPASAPVTVASTWSKVGLWFSASPTAVAQGIQAFA